MVGAAVLAAAIALILCRPWNSPDAARTALGEALAIGVVFFVGGGVVLRWPRWPFAGPEDRLLAVILPALVLVEVVACRRVPRWLAWTMRFAVAASVAPVLLFDSIYLANSGGPGSRLWTPGQIGLWLTGLAVVLAAVWVLLSFLTLRTSSRSVALVLAVVCAGAAPTIMFSGYLTGGPLLLPLAGALVGTAVASLAWPLPRGARPAVSIGIVLLFGVLLIGRFFGELSDQNAVLLLLAPLLAWLPELPPGKHLRPWARGIASIILVALPMAYALNQARQPATAPGGPASPSREPSLEDYQQFSR
jgi:hypothetical protein